MSITVAVIVGGDDDAEAVSAERPRFINPVPAEVRSSGRRMGELDAHLTWDGDRLFARVALPDLPGHQLKAACEPETVRGPGGTRERWIRSLRIAIEHVDDIIPGVPRDAPPVRGNPGRGRDAKREPRRGR